jgi:hypothetical protein
MTTTYELGACGCGPCRGARGQCVVARFALLVRGFRAYTEYNVGDTSLEPYDIPAKDEAALDDIPNTSIPIHVNGSCEVDQYGHSLNDVYLTETVTKEYLFEDYPGTGQTQQWKSVIISEFNRWDGTYSSSTADTLLQGSWTFIDEIKSSPGYEPYITGGLRIAMPGATGAITEATNDHVHLKAEGTHDNPGESYFLVEMDYQLSDVIVYQESLNYFQGLYDGLTVPQMFSRYRTDGKYAFSGYYDDIGVAQYPSALLFTNVPVYDQVSQDYYQRNSLVNYESGQVVTEPGTGNSYGVWNICDYLNKHHYGEYAFEALKLGIVVASTWNYDVLGTSSNYNVNTRTRDMCTGLDGVTTKTAFELTELGDLGVEVGPQQFKDIINCDLFPSQCR